MRDVRVILDPIKEYLMDLNSALVFKELVRRIGNSLDVLVSASGGGISPREVTFSVS